MEFLWWNMFLEQDLLKMLLKQIQVILICMEYILYS